MSSSIKVEAMRITRFGPNAERPNGHYTIGATEAVTGKRVALQVSEEVFHKAARNVLSGQLDAVLAECDEIIARFTQGLDSSKRVALNSFKDTRRELFRRFGLTAALVNNHTLPELTDADGDSEEEAPADGNSAEVGMQAEVNMASETHTLESQQFA